MFVVFEIMVFFSEIFVVCVGIKRTMHAGLLHKSLLLFFFFFFFFCDFYVVFIGAGA